MMKWMPILCVTGILLITALSLVVVLIFRLIFSPKQHISIGKMKTNKTHRNAPDYPWLPKVEDVWIKTKTGIRLHAFSVMQAHSAPWILLVHGYRGQASHMAKYMDHFLIQGYNALAVDLRGHVQSQGEIFGLGALDKDDIRLWIEWINTFDCNAQTVLFGTSMGAATVLLYGGCYGNDVSAIISDSAPTSIKMIIQRILKHRLGFICKVMLPVLDFVLNQKAGYRMSDATPVSVIGNIRVPILLIHGKSDGFVPHGMASELFSKCNSPADLLLVEGADHVHSVDTDPVVYWSTVDQFLNIQMEVENAR